MLWLEVKNLHVEINGDAAPRYGVTAIAALIVGLIGVGLTLLH